MPFTSSRRRRPGDLRRFALHYLEMIAAMLAGMVVLGIPAEAALRAAGSGTGELRTDAPALALLGMGVVMTVPMVAWMRLRGHGARACGEMAAAMLVPTAAVMVLLEAGVGGFDAMMAAEHVAMLPSMLLVMLMRFDEYACRHGRGGRHGREVTA
jgi:flagellar biosynthetic protein FliP